MTPGSRCLCETFSLITNPQPFKLIDNAEQNLLTALQPFHINSVTAPTVPVTPSSPLPLSCLSVHFCSKAAFTGQ